MDGLKLAVSIGIHDFERTGPQPYLLDIGLQLSEGYRSFHDSLDETVDYDALRSLVSAHLESRHFNLQETLMQDVITICFALDIRVIAVDIRTHKTTVYPNCNSVGLHYQIERAEWLLALS